MKAKAIAKMKNSLYRQEEHTDYIYALVDLKDHTDPMTLQLPAEFKQIN